uniref:Uncharacterized protein n=1 Tax=Cyprinus carpio TaxID=7962 RepID=A0A8C1G1V5_CYPCA
MFFPTNLNCCAFVTTRTQTGRSKSSMFIGHRAPPRPPEQHRAPPRPPEQHRAPPRPPEQHRAPPRPPEQHRHRAPPRPPEQHRAPPRPPAWAGGHLVLWRWAG